MDTGYVWDENKYLRVQEEHEVSFWEVVSALSDPYGLEKADDASDEENQWVWVGQTIQGRVLVVIYDDLEDAPLLRLITAFDAEGEWFREYKEQNKTRN